MARSIALSTLEKMLNRALSLDPYCGETLKSLDGKLIEVALSHCDLSVFIRILSTGVQLESPCDEAVPDIHLYGSVADYIKMVTDIRRARPVFGSQVRISGDVEVVQNLKTLLSELEIDWEEQVSQWLGDTAAHGISLALRSLNHWSQQTADAFWSDLGEYLSEEKRVVLHADEVRVYLDEVDDIRDDVERLIARVERLR